MASLGKAIQQATIHRRMSLEELAAESGMREDVLKKFVYGQRTLTSTELEKLMEILDLELVMRKSE